MGDLSPNFNKAEFADHKTGECKVDMDLIDGLEKLRSLVGKPIHVHSGYRSPATNATAGGVGHSQHMEGKAADISIEGYDTFQLYVLADQIDVFRNGGIGIYPGEKFIHVDVRDGRARWSRVDGKYVGISQWV